MSEGDQHIDVGALPKFDKPLHTSDMTAKDVKSLALRHSIPLDLHPVALTKEWTMDKLSDDMIRLYEQYFEFSVIRVPFSRLPTGRYQAFSRTYFPACAFRVEPIDDV
ncbi:hypothetical protein Tco_1395359 [Tanacetum coccineum]